MFSAAGVLGRILSRRLTDKIFHTSRVPINPFFSQNLRLFHLFLNTNPPLIVVIIGVEREESTPKATNAYETR